MKNAKQYLGVLFVLTLAAVGTGFPAVAEEAVALSDVPAAVRATIEQQAAGAEVREIEVDSEDGQEVYEVELFRDGKEVDIRISSAGEFLGMDGEEEGENESEEEGEEEGDEEGEEQGEQEQEIALSEAPEAVQATIRKTVGTNPIGKVTMESDDDEAVYEAEFTVDGVQHSVKCAASGDPLEYEYEIDPKSLPAAALEELKEDYPDAVIQKAEAVQVFFFEVELVKGEKTFEVKVLASGDIEDESDDCDDEDGDDEDDGEDEDGEDNDGEDDDGEDDDD